MSSDSHFYVTGGSLRADAPSYVERQADRDLLEGLLRGEFCYVLTSRQMGKSSLMIRTARRLRNRRVGVIVLDLTAVGQNVTPEQWYDGLAVQIGRQLDMEDEVDDYWLHHAEVGPCQRFFMILRECMSIRAAAGPEATMPVPDLPAMSPGESDSGDFTRVIYAEGKDPGGDPRLVVFVDEIDAVRSLSFSTDEFFAAIRECYNRRAQDPLFDRLTFCLLGVATPSDLVRDTRTTPFNIGRRIELHDFTNQEARPLATGLAGHAAQTDTSFFRQDSRSHELLDRVLYWTNGHPYLTQRLCRAVADAARHKAKGRGPGVSAEEVRPDVDTVDRICEDLFLSKAARSTNDNLLFVRDRLVRTDADPAAVLTLYRRVRKGAAGPDDAASPLANSLRLAGVVRPYETELQVRNRIYERVFDLAWVEEQMPGGELRRQKEAFRKGVVRTTAFGIAILTLMIGLLLYALHQRSDAQKAARESIERSARLHAANGVSRIERGYLLDALPSLVESLRVSAKGSADEAIARIRLACVLLQTPRLIQFWRYEGPLTGTALSEDGRLLITLGDTNVVQIWDVTAGAPTGEPLVHNAPVESVAFNQAADRLLTVDTNHQVRVWRIGERQVRSIALADTNLERAVFASDGRHLVTLGSNGRLRCWDDDGKQVAERVLPAAAAALFADADRMRVAVVTDLPNSFQPRLHRVEILAVPTLETVGTPLDHRARAGIFEATFSPDGRWLATACTDDRAWLWDLQSGKAVLDADDDSPFRHVSWVRTARFNSTSDRLVTASFDGTARIWSIRNRALDVAPLAHMHTVHEARFSRDGRLVVTASAEGTATVWDARTAERAWAPVHHNGYVMNAWLTPDGSRLISVGQDNSVRVSKKPPGLAYVPLVDGPNAAIDLAFSADGRRLVTYGKDSRVKVWEVPSGHLFDSWLTPKESDPNWHYGTCVINPDGSLAAVARSEDRSGHWKGWLEIHGVGQGSAVVAEVQREGIISALEFDPRDGRRLLMSTDRGTIELLDPSSGAVLTRMTNCIPGISVARFSGDGRLIAASSEKGLIQVFTSDGRQSWTNAAPQQCQIADLAFSPDGTRVVFGCSDLSLKSRAAYIWSFRTSKPLVPLPHADGVTVVRVSPDGRRAATASEDGTVRLWDMETGHPLAQAVRHLYQAARVAFDPDNRILLTAGSYGDVRILDVRTAELLGLPLQVEGRVFALEHDPKGKFFVTASGRGSPARDLRLWSMPEERRSIEELKALSELLSGNYIDPTAGPTQVSEEEVERLWQELRGRHPELRP